MVKLEGESDAQKVYVGSINGQKRVEANTLSAINFVEVQGDENDSGYSGPFEGFQRF